MWDPHALEIVGNGQKLMRKRKQWLIPEVCEHYIVRQVQRTCLVVQLQKLRAV